MKYIFPIVVTGDQVFVGWNLALEDYEDDFDEMPPTEEEMRRIRAACEREKQWELGQ